MPDSYLDSNGNTFWCYETPSVNFEYTQNRIRCGNIIIDNCTGGGLQGDCTQTAINNGLILCEPEDSWNCHLCPNDLPYFSPVRVTDPFMFQFQQWDYINGQSPTYNPITGTWGQGAGWGTMVDGVVLDCCGDFVPIGGDILSYALEQFVGMYNVIQYNGLDQWTNIQQISLDLQAIYDAGILANPDWNGCFYLQFYFKDADGNIIRTFTTEPYKFDPCQPDDTIFLEGVYNKQDCFKYFYGNPVSNPNNWIGIGTPFQYRNTYRVKGSFELSGFEINKEFVGIRQFTANTETAENWLFRTNRLPARVARLIANILAADTVYVDGRDYIASGTITKNNDIGNQWFLESQLKRVQCSSTNSCD